MLVHQFLKWRRFKYSRWQPIGDHEKVPDGVRVNLNIIERELTPSIFVVACLISVGAY